MGKSGSEVLHLLWCYPINNLPVQTLSLFPKDPFFPTGVTLSLETECSGSLSKEPCSVLQ